MEAGRDATFEQKRGREKIFFGIGPRHLDYRCVDSEGSVQARKIDWSDVAPPSDHVSTFNGDQALSWVLMTMPALAIFASIRGSDQPLALALYAGAALMLAAVLIATRRLRRKAQTSIPAKGLSVTVLADRDHDAVVSAIAERRAEAIQALAPEPAEGETIRERLRRLRWLVAQEALPPETFEAERRRMTGLGGAETSPPDLDLTQRGLGESLRFGFRADHLEYESRTPFDGGGVIRLPYRQLGPRSEDLLVERDVRMAIIWLGWFGAVVMAMMSVVSQSHPPDHYVGGPGLPRALADYGPMLVLMAIGVALIDRWTRRRRLAPYPRVFVRPGRDAERILNEIERRRVAALRRYAEPDPLLRPDERAEMLDALVADGAISEQERAEAFGREAALEVDPELDEPAAGGVRKPATTLH